MVVRISRQSWDGSEVKAESLFSLEGLSSRGPDSRCSSSADQIFQSPRVLCVDRQRGGALRYQPPTSRFRRIPGPPRRESLVRAPSPLTFYGPPTSRLVRGRCGQGFCFVTAAWRLGFCQGTCSRKHFFFCASEVVALSAS